MKQAEANHELNIVEHKQTQHQVSEIAERQKKMMKMMKELVETKRQKKNNDMT